MKERQYQSLVDSLMHLSVCTRSDIDYAVSCLARFSSKPNKSHRTADKCVLRYLWGTADYGTMFTMSESEQCVAISDANWARDLQDKRSTSGYLFQIVGGPISWKSRKQGCVASLLAEYMALSSAAQETI